MRNLLIMKKLLLIFGVVSLALSAVGKPVDLLCEYLENPQGIDILQPRFSWKMEADRRGARQTAYQVLVASSRERLARDEGDLWDSGKVDSAQSTQVLYGGEALTSRMSCYWKVQVWNENGEVSAYSEPAVWTMGLLNRSDWKGKWISIDANQRPPRASVLSLENAQWIWHPEDNHLQCSGDRVFRKTFSFDRSKCASPVSVIASADDRFFLKINGIMVLKGASWQSPTQADITDYLADGENTIQVEVKNRGKSGGLIAKVEYTDSSGNAVSISTDPSWQVMKVQREKNPWLAAKVLGSYGMKPWAGMKPYKHPELDSRYSPMLRKTFALSKEVASAQVSICGLGYYELYLNGDKVGDHVLDPIWTTYHRNALYVTYDLTTHLKAGKHAFGVQLANGMYNQEFVDTWHYQDAPWRAFPQMILQLDVIYQDGTTERIVSDESWKASTGPITWDMLRMGVKYDARLEQDGWATPGFDDRSWTPVIVREGSGGSLSAQMSEPIKVMQTLEAQSTENTREGRIVDFGQNMAGWTRLKVSGTAGTTLVLDHGQQGLSQGAPLQTSTYTLKGEGTEVWEPDFSFYGFKKVKISGIPELPQDLVVDAQVVHTAFDERGAFECSNPLMNKLVSMSRWSYIGNFVGIPSDCPHREKLGWTGDAQLATELGLNYFGSEAAYTQWIHDFVAAQADDGKLPCIIPDGGRGWGTRFLDGPSWESAFLIIPRMLYDYRGDQEILKRYYEDQKKWFSWYRDPNRIIKKTRVEAGGGGSKHSIYKNPQPVNQNHIITYGIGDWPPNGLTPFELTSTAHYYRSAVILAETAAMLGKEDERAEYEQLAQEVKAAFNQAFYDRDKGIYAQGSDTAMSCALYFGLVEPAERQRVADNLAQRIKDAGYATDVACLGSKYVLRVLADNGHLETAYSVINRQESPGWGYLAASGRTTISERMNGGGSDNHVFLGDVSAWMMTYLAGIRPDPAYPGFQRFKVYPQWAVDLKWVKGHHDSPYGRVVSEWKRGEETFELKVTIPPNSSAEVYLPTSRASEALESGEPISNVPGVKFLREEADRSVYEVSSGNYHFTTTHLAKGNHTQNLKHKNSRESRQSERPATNPE